MTSREADAASSGVTAVTSASDAWAENARVRLEILRRLGVDLFPRGRPTTLTCGDWEILDFSSCFGLEWTSDAAPNGAYVKIPKADITRQSVLPTSKVDCRMAEEEHASLQYLARHWEGAGGDARFVDPLAFYPDLNAIVTRRAWGSDLLHAFRRIDFRARLGMLGEVARLNGILQRIGTAVARFHENCTRADGLGEGTADLSHPISKIVRAADDLRQNGVPERRLSALLVSLRAVSPPPQRVSLAMSLKGLDVRNILFDSRRDRLTFLDPGKMKVEPRQANLARLLVTIRILYWGTPWFVARLAPASAFEGVVLAAADGAVDDRILSLYVVKELWKHWRAAHVALTLKGWPRPLERGLARGYIDRFYATQIGSELSRMVR